MTLQELLAQADLGDDFDIEVKGNKFKVGDLRGMSRAVDAEKRVMELKRREAEKLADDASQLLAGLNEAAAKNKTVQQKTDANAGYDWKTDPLYAPVVSEIAAVMAEAKRAVDLAETQRKQLEQVSSIYAFERMRTEYERSGYKDKSFEELAQEAIAAKQYDRFGLPTLGPSITRLTEPTRIKAAQDEAVKAARATWDAEQNAAAAAPGRGGAARITTHKAATAAPPNKRIEDITAEMVAADPDVQAAMRGESVS